MCIRRTLVTIIVITLLASVSGTAEARSTAVDPRASGVSCGLPESDAASLVILHDYFRGHWWDHADLTVAVQAHPSATEQQLAAIHGAIATWGAVIHDCFDGRIALTDVTGTQPSEQRAADIVIHFVPTAGGVVFVGLAQCGDHGCPNVLIRSDPPPGQYAPGGSFPLWYLGSATPMNWDTRWAWGMPLTCMKAPI